jgi:hypothetical protein
MPHLKRSEKSLAGMAAGAWLLGEAWLKDSPAAGRLLPAEGYELNSDAAVDSVISLGEMTTAF